MIRDIAMITLGVIGGAVGTVLFVRSELKRYNMELKKNRIYDKKTIIFESRNEADSVYESMNKILDTYGCVSVCDLYDLMGITSDYTKMKIGWTDLDDMRIITFFGKTMLKLPKIIELK